MDILVYKLEHVNLFYSKYRQEDALETLLNLLNNINDTFETQRPADMFLMETEVYCRCLRQSYITSAYYSSFEPETCLKCRQPFDKQIVNNPEYLLYANNSYDVKKEVTVNRESYQLMSQIIYSGSGYSGHYTCLREEKGVIYNFNDSSIS